MQTDWFPFFSMLFWLVTKVVALALLLAGLTGLLTMLATGFGFGSLLLTVLAPAAVGWLVLSTDLLYDVATAEQRRRAKSSR